MIHWNAKPTPGLILAIGSHCSSPTHAALVSTGALSALLVAILMIDAHPVTPTPWKTSGPQPIRRGEGTGGGRCGACGNTFEAPDWRGTAHYEAGDFRSSSAEFGKLDSADALYNRGNALALSGDFQGAIDSYDKSLEAEPDRQDAIDNRELVKSLLEQQQQEQQGNDQDSNSDQSDQEGESQDSESDLLNRNRTAASLRRKFRPFRPTAQ